MIQATDVLAAGLFASQNLNPAEGEARLWADLPEEARSVFRADAAFLCNYLGSGPIQRLDRDRAAKALLSTSLDPKQYRVPQAAILAFQQLHPVTRG